MQPQQSVIKHAGDGVAVATLVAWGADVLPVIATGLTVIWFALQILEKVTGKTVPQMLRCIWARMRGG